jgi:hypothetical protein
LFSGMLGKAAILDDVTGTIIKKEGDDKRRKKNERKTSAIYHHLPKQAVHGRSRTMPSRIWVPDQAGFIVESESREAHANIACNVVRCCRKGAFRLDPGRKMLRWSDHRSLWVEDARLEKGRRSWATPLWDRLARTPPNFISSTKPCIPPTVRIHRSQVSVKRLCCERENR